MLITLILVYAICLAVPMVLWLRLPKPLHPPRDESAPEFPRHLAALQARLNDNAYLKQQGVRVTNRREIEAALRLLDQRAQAIITNTASIVFTSTAISQNGYLRLDCVGGANASGVASGARVQSASHAARTARPVCERQRDGIPGRQPRRD